MQRFACLSTGERVEATEATHHVDYYCPECNDIVRVRRGEERAPHFFHKNEGASCHIRLKGGLHLAVQSNLIRLLGPTTCTCECYFPAISRVADIAYHPQNIVFEVQVSPIDPQEALARTLSYWGIGWHVIWLLHAATFGKPTASPFERILLPIPHYFTDIGYRGGAIWDESSSVRGSKRYWYSLPPHRKIIDDLSITILRSPSATPLRQGFSSSAARYVQMRRTSWSCHFQHDLLSSTILDTESRKKSWNWALLWKQAKVACHLFWLRCIG